MSWVQRSGLSHILSGRNKPGYDFISKFLNCFPTINADWLLTGRGKPYKDINEITPPSSYNFKRIDENNSSQNSIIDKKEDVFSISSGFGFNQNNTHTQQSSDIQENKAGVEQSKLSQNSINTDNNKGVRKNKSVKRVIIFYSDGSFDEMYPMT